MGLYANVSVNLATQAKDAPAASGSSSQMKSGALAAISKTCNTGDLYLANDQPAGQQIYSCANGSSWSPTINIGASGALSFQNGGLDVVPSVVPTLQSQNVFSGLNSFNLGIRFTTPAAKPDCSASLRGLLWFMNNGTAKDNVQVYLFDGQSFSWVSLY